MRSLIRDGGLLSPSFKAQKRTKSCSLGRPRCSRVELLHQSRALVGSPPPDFHFRAETQATTERILARDYPELVDLARKGVLVVVPRRLDYTERRTDGYREPEMVYLVGTIHISQKSAEAVTRVIEAVKPDNVVVELCRTRTPTMYGSDMPCSPDISGQDDAANVRLASLRKAVEDALHGSSSMTGLLTRFLAMSASSRLQQQVGVRAGVEARAARIAAERVGAQIVLGDRPIEITLGRVWNALSWMHRWRLMRQLLAVINSPLPSLDAKDLAELDTDDMVTAMTKQLTGTYPEVASALLHERDLYLAWSMKRSKAVNGCKAVVGIVGRGHLPGVVYHLMRESSNLRFRDLAGTRQRTQRARLGIPGWVTVLAGNIALGFGLQAMWEAFRQTGH